MSDPRAGRVAELRQQLLIARISEEHARAYIATPAATRDREQAWQRLRDLLAAPVIPERALWTLGAVTEVVHAADWAVRSVQRAEALREQIRKLEVGVPTEAER